MTDLWEIARYVESHPASHKSRWRLAKKLYEAQEYRLALEHLQILKNEWVSKINVRRYLAAVLFRMNRHEEAVRELREALESWPDEIGLHEQLAWVLEAAERFDEAAEVWEDIARRIPKHPAAASAAVQLRAKLPTSDVQEVLPGRDSAFMATCSTVCPNCNARNNDFLDKCWQCGAPLADAEEESAAQAPKAAAPPLPSPIGWRLPSAIAAVALLGVTVFFSLRYTTMAMNDSLVVTSVPDLLGKNLLLARSLAMGALLFAWPLGIWVGLNLIRAGEDDLGDIVLLGALMTAITAAVTWLPPALIGVGLLVPVLTSLLSTKRIFRITPGQACLVWLVQMLCAAGAAAVPFAILEGPAFFKEWPAIARYAKLAPPGARTFNETAAPFHIRWPGSGSMWLDEKARQVEFVVRASPENAALTFELKTGPETAAYQYLHQYPAHLILRILPNTDYTLSIFGDKGATVSLEVRGTLTPISTP